jgi:hypothetical protein
MKHLKKFETFDFSQTVPVTTKNFLTNYYSCDECDNLWKEFNKESKSCKCGSTEIEELPEDEWCEIAEVRGINTEDRKDDQEAISLFDLKKDNNNDVN